MGSKWKRVTVADVCTSIVDCVNKTAPVVEYPTNYKMIRTPNIRSGKVTLDGCRYVEKEVYETWTRRSKPQKEDVLLTREAPLGEVGIITTDENIFLGQRIMQYRADKNKIDPYFLLYSFLSPDLQQQFLMHEGSGSVVSHIRVGDCSKFEINIPPLEVQRSIVEILKSIDDHIDVNKKINQTLEQMSQTLFKSWFVDFDPVIDNALDAGNPIPEALQSRAELRQKVRNSANFKPLPAEIRALFPAEYVESESGWIPKGWESESFDSFCDFIQSGGTPSRKETSFWNDGTIKWLSSGEVKGKIVLDTKEKITQTGLLHSSAKLWKRYTTVVAMYGATAGEVCIIGDKMTANQACCGLYSEKYPFYVYNFVSNKTDELASKATGSAQQNLNKLIISSTKFIRPSNAIITIFEDNVAPLFMKWFSNSSENNTLTILRDTLLPKLISGELSLEDLPDIIKQTEAA